MPFRHVPLATGEIYHVFNRSVGQIPIFERKKDYHRCLSTIDFYRFNDTSIRFSHLRRLPHETQRLVLNSLYNSGSDQVEILAFCLMPNHVHFLLKQLKDGGISRFMAKFQNSYARYFNLQISRIGTLFENMFKAKRIETEAQLVHVARYIHLNPLTAYIIKNLHQLPQYQWSSYNTYIQSANMAFVSTDMLLSLFPSREAFAAFTLDQAQYQRELEKIKHLILE